MTNAYSSILLLSLAVLTIGGCASPQETFSKDQDKAIDAAVRRGRFEMNCPQATGTVLSSNMLQPVLWGGMERAEYTIGVEGCSKRST